MPPLRGSGQFPTDRGLTTRRLSTNVAAARLIRGELWRFVPPSSPDLSYETNLSRAAPWAKLSRPLRGLDSRPGAARSRTAQFLTRVPTQTLPASTHRTCLVKELPGPAHWVRPWRTQQRRPPDSLIRRRACLPQVRRSRLHVMLQGARLCSRALTGGRTVGLQPLRAICTPLKSEVSQWLERLLKNAKSRALTD